MKRTHTTILLGLLSIALACASRSALGVDDSTTIDAETVKKWSAPYRGWHYYPDHVILPAPKIKGFEDVRMTDVPNLFQLAGDDKWYMTFVGYDGKGYQSFVAESDDLIEWTNLRLSMGWGPEGSFYHGGVVLGAFLYDDYDITARRTLKKVDGRYLSLFGAYPKRGGYELGGGGEGVGESDDGLSWRAAKEETILSIHDEDVGFWENRVVYQPFLLEHGGKYWNFYNARRANGAESIGIAFSDDLFELKRYENNPVLTKGPDGSWNEHHVADGKVWWDTDHWVMFFSV